MGAWGRVISGAGEGPAFRVLDANDAEIEAISDFLRELTASDCSPLTVRSYAHDLLRWFRFLDATGVDWEGASRDQVRDLVLWLRTTTNPQRMRQRPGSPSAGSVNVTTGKRYLSAGYAPTTINHALSVISEFYRHHRDRGRGPGFNPVPEAGRGRRRLNAHHNPMEPFAPHRRGPYRQKVPERAPRGLSDHLFDELFASLTSNRDRALLAFYVSSGARASELLALRGRDVDWGQHTIWVVSKGSRQRERIPASPDSFVWLALYLNEGTRRPPDDPLWWTLRAPICPLSYGAARAVLMRANAKLGTNVTLHDLRHTCGLRLARDPNMTLIDIKTILRHQNVSTTQIYTAVQLDDIVEKVVAHYSRPAPAPQPAPALPYDHDEMRELFGSAT